MSNEILIEFIDDAREHLQAASQHLLALESNPSAGDDLNGLLRRMHTIKGNAGFLDLNNLFSLLHTFENILQIEREAGRDTLIRDTIEVQLHVLDTVETMLNQIENNGNDYTEGLEELIAELDRISKIQRDFEMLPDDSISGAQDRDLGETPPADSVPEPKSIPSPLHQEMDLNQIEWFEDLLHNHNPDEVLPRGQLEDNLEAIRVDVELLGGVQSRDALEIILEYWQDLVDQGRPLTGTPISIIMKLLHNLKMWVIEESDDLQSASPPFIEVDLIDLEEGGRELIRRIEAWVEKEPRPLIVDLRRFQVLRSSQIGVLLTALKEVPGKQASLLLDPVTQQGLIKVLKVLGLDKIYQIHESPGAALSQTS